MTVSNCGYMQTGIYAGVKLMNGGTSPNCLWHLFPEEVIFYLMTHSTHFIYGYMVLEIW